MEQKFDYATRPDHEIHSEHLVHDLEVMNRTVAGWESRNRLETERAVHEGGRVVIWDTRLTRPADEALADSLAVAGSAVNHAASSVMAYAASPTEDNMSIQAIVRRVPEERMEIGDADLTSLPDYTQQLGNPQSLVVARVRKAHEQPLEGEHVAYNITVTTTGQTSVFIRLGNDDWRRVSIPNTKTELRVDGRVLGAPKHSPEDPKLNGAASVRIHHDGQEILLVRVVASENITAADLAATGLVETANGLGVLTGPQVLARYGLETGSVAGMPAVMDMKVGPPLFLPEDL